MFAGKKSAQIREILISESAWEEMTCLFAPSLGHTYHAKDYGSLLKNAGFSVIGTFETPREGDVIVIQPYAGGNPSGHMALFDGQHWYSDFRQRDMWAGPGYRAAKPPYVIYRKN